MTRRDGFTLLLVIGALTIGALLSAWAAQATRTQAANVSALNRQASLAAAADGALAVALWQMDQARFDTNADQRARDDSEVGEARPVVRPDGRVNSYTIGTAQVEVRLIDETGLVDLNQAGFETLTAAFLAAGVERTLAEQLAVEIEDWRDRDSERRPGGAEQASYPRSDPALFIGNRPFRSVVEARALLSMTGPVFEAVQPYLTISGASEPALDFAPLPLINALRELSVGERRVSGPGSNADDGNGDGGSGSGRMTAYLVATTEDDSGYAEAVRLVRVADSVQPRILSRRRLSLDEAERVFAGADRP